jgi:hypothetical protein
MPWTRSAALLLLSFWTLLFALSFFAPLSLGLIKSGYLDRGMSMRGGVTQFAWSVADNSSRWFGREGPEPELNGLFLQTAAPVASPVLVAHRESQWARLFGAVACKRGSGLLRANGSRSNDMVFFPDTTFAALVVGQVPGFAIAGWCVLKVARRLWRFVTTPGAHYRILSGLDCAVSFLAHVGLERGREVSPTLLFCDERNRTVLRLRRD